MTHVMTRITKEQGFESGPGLFLFLLSEKLLLRQDIGDFINGRLGKCLGGVGGGVLMASRVYEAAICEKLL